VPDFLPKALDNFFPEISDKNFLNIFWGFCFSQVNTMTLHFKFWQQHCNV
jgi:hypothetical protein